MAKERLGGLDMLRGVAALSVVFLHIPLAFPAIDTPFTKAYLAVDFFFMLSGFVLTRTYHSRLGAGLGAFQFMSLRLHRLWPTIAFGAALGFINAFDAYTPDKLALLLAMNLALLPYFFGGGKAAVFPLNGALWSIFFELVANFLHAKVLVSMSQRLLLLLTAIMAVVMLIVATQLKSFDAGAWDGNFIVGLPRVMLSYLIGCLLYLNWGDRARHNLPRVAAPVMLLAGLIVGWWIDGGWLFDMVFVLLVCPAVLMAGLRKTGRGHWSEQVAGDLSFPLYATHVPVLLLAAKADLPWLGGALVAFLCAAVTLYFTRVKSLDREPIQKANSPASA